MLNNICSSDSSSIEGDSGEVRKIIKFKHTRRASYTRGASETNLSDATKNVSISEFEDNNELDTRNVSFSQFDEDVELNTKEKMYCLVQDTREVVGTIVNDDRVQNFILSLIVINSLMLGIGTFSFVKDNPKVEYIFEMSDKTFLIIFTIELCMQAFFHLWSMFKDGWLVFDFVVVVMSWAFSQMQGIRAFRIFRALRLITRFRTMRNLLSALFCVMPRLGAILTLLCLIFYVFGVMFTEIFMVSEASDELDDEACHYYFDTLHHSLFTLFQMLTLEWAAVARSCIDEYSWAWAPIVIFVMITSFIVFNLIVAVVCDAVSELHETKTKKRKSERKITHRKQMEELKVQIKSLSAEVNIMVKDQERIQKALDYFALSEMTD